jgi:hypothetical protein
MGKISSIILAIIISTLPFGWFDSGVANAQTEQKPTEQTDENNQPPIAEPTETTEESTAEQSVQQVFTNLMGAIATNDYEKFIAEGNSGFQDAITKEMFTPVSEELANRLKAGYSTVFLGELKQQNYQVYVWKLTFKDGGDDFLARMSLKDGKVGGFWLN